MPAPAVYILAIVGTVAAGVAFKAFVYEPHIAPRVERWAEEFIAKRQARRRQKEAAVVVVVPLRSGNDEDRALRSRKKRSDSGASDGEDRRSFELERLVAKEVHEWRSEVGRSHSLGARHRRKGPASRNSTSLDESNVSIPYSPITPTHVIFDPSRPSTPTSTTTSRVPSPLTKASSLRNTPSESRSTLRSPTPNPTMLPTPDQSISPDPPIASITASPTQIPSLSMSHPLDLDLEHDLELLSVPSSRPTSPFSAPDTTNYNTNYHSFSPSNLTSPVARPSSRAISDLDLLSDFEDGVSVQSSAISVDSESAVGDDEELRSITESEVSASSWASAGLRNS